jgi:hypothetical protein
MAIKEKLSLIQVPLGELKEWCNFFLACVLLICVFYVGTRASLEWSQNYLPLPLHLIVIALWALIVLGWVRGISGEFGKSVFIKSYVNGILWPPFFYSFSLLFMAMAVFASLSVVLQRYGHVKFEPPLPSELSPVVDFYMWQFLDSVPGLGIPQTLRWTQPYQYSDHLSGALLLVFRVAVIVPVIASFKVWHDVRKIAVTEKKKKAGKRKKTDS